MNEVQKQGLLDAVKILGVTILIILGIVYYTAARDPTSTIVKPTTPSYQPTYQTLPSTTTHPIYQPTIRRTAPTYSGYTCSDDCSGHEAGYEYAEENDYTQDDVDNYSGDSESFQEGLQSYVDEQ